MSDERAFVDTNILAYAYDKSDPKRRMVCKDLVQSGFRGESSFCISNQVLAELFTVLTRSVARPLSRSRASVVVSAFIDSPKWNKLDYGHLTVRRALEDSKSINISFWDILIADTMREAGVSRLFTENERDFSKIPWIEVINPTTAATHNSPQG